MELPCDVGVKICSTVSGHMTKMASRPIYGKTLQNLLRNQEADNLETWYTASGIEYYQICSNDDTGLTVTIFMTWSHLFLMLLHGWKLIQHIVMYFQACSKSAYPQHSGERYRTIGLQVLCCYWKFIRYASHITVNRELLIGRYIIKSVPTYSSHER